MRNILVNTGLCLFLWLAALPAMAQPIAQDESAAVILVYNRIGEDEYPETNLRQEQFDSHIRELVSGKYNVLPLPEIVTALKQGRKLPPYTVALTFDGGHRSVLLNAVPLLKKHDLPFTIFTSTDHAGRTTDEYLSWGDLRALKRDRLASIGLHPATYTRLYGETEDEIARQLNNARAAYRDEMGEEPTLFAYPFGEYSALYRTLIEQQGFAAAFGQQSGVAYSGSDPFSLPRFSMTESYGDLDRFTLTADALPLPVTDIEPRDPVLDTPLPSVGFTVDAALKGQLADLTCFVTGQAKPELQILSDTRVELRLEKSLESDRARVNCTLPLTTGENYDEPRWRWFGMLLLPPAEYEQKHTNNAAMVQADG